MFDDEEWHVLRIVGARTDCGRHALGQTVRRQPALGAETVKVAQTPALHAFLPVGDQQNPGVGRVAYRFLACF